MLLVMLTATACGESGRLVDPGAPSLAKGGGPAGTPSVSAATPAYGYRGETDKAVTISGSGFEPGAVATWERGGVTDGKVVVTSTQFVSSSQLVATLDIAADADISFYDVAVTTLGGKKGIGTEKFEVTTAVVPTLDGAGNNSYAWGMNAAGQIVGRSNGNAFFWDPSTGLDNLGT
ncbi:MAG TPA: hypothetical protein VF862_11105, partial [Gemmatimonadales bacterium]